MQEMQAVRAFVDRIEGETAVLLLGEDEFVKVQAPVDWLPRGVREGTVLRLGFSIDEEATKDRKSKVRSLLDSMPNEP